jgi:hypothetical protein
MCPASPLLHRVVSGQGRQKNTTMTGLATLKFQPCRALVAAPAVLVPSVGQAEGQELENDDVLVQLVNNIVLDWVGQRPLRQVWAFPRSGNAVGDLEVWRAHDLTNDMERFFVGELRMSEECYNVLLAELEIHPLMDVNGNAFREPHDARRKLMAWLKWVGCNASLGDVGKFRRIAKGTLVRENGAREF